MSAIKHFKELMETGQPLISEVWTDGNYQIMLNNITGKYLISSDKGFTSSQQIALGGSFDTQEGAIQHLQSFKRNF